MKLEPRMRQNVQATEMIARLHKNSTNAPRWHTLEHEHFAKNLPLSFSLVYYKVKEKGESNMILR
jgi:hypothetical protein